MTADNRTNRIAEGDPSLDATTTKRAAADAMTAAHEALITQAMRLMSARDCVRMSELCLKLSRDPDMRDDDRRHLINEAKRWHNAAVGRW